MFSALGLSWCIRVALRKESVDRNLLLLGAGVMLGGSLSARRAWIEIRACILTITIYTVALRKESVDRNSAEKL